METLTFLGLSLVLTGGALWIIGCLVNLCKAGKPKVHPRNPRVVYLEDQLVIATQKRNARILKNKLNGEAREWQKETKITLAPSRRLCEEAVKHLN